MPVGSSLRQSSVERAVVANPVDVHEQQKSQQQQCKRTELRSDLEKGFLLKSMGGKSALTQRNIIHIVHNHALVLRRILSYSRQCSFCNVIAIKERHFSIGFQPNFVLFMSRTNEHRVNRSSISSVELQRKLTAYLGKLCQII